MSLTEEQRSTLELMRTDNASAGFPFAASEAWIREVGNFERVFDATGVDRLPANTVDLMVNVASFQEMNADQVNRYLEIFDEIAFGGYVYLRNEYIGGCSRIDEYRFPEGWLRKFSRDSAYSAQCHEGGWRVT